MSEVLPDIKEKQLRAGKFQRQVDIFRQKYPSGYLTYDVTHSDILWKLYNRGTGNYGNYGEGIFHKNGASALWSHYVKHDQMLSYKLAKEELWIF